MVIYVLRNLIYKEIQYRTIEEGSRHDLTTKRYRISCRSQLYYCVQCMHVCCKSKMSISLFGLTTWEIIHLFQLWYVRTVNFLMVLFQPGNNRDIEFQSVLCSRFFFESLFQVILQQGGTYILHDFSTFRFFLSFIQPWHKVLQKKMPGTAKNKVTALPVTPASLGPRGSLTPHKSENRYIFQKKLQKFTKGSLSHP